MLKFLVFISLVVTFSEALPLSPWYNIGERVGLTWSNDQTLADLGLPLNPRPQYLQNIEATEERKRRSANPEPQNSWYNIGERVGLTWSNDQALTDLGLPLNPRPLYLQNIEATEKRKRRSANPEPINGGRGRWFIKGQRGSTVRWSNDQFLQDASLPVNPPGEEATG